MHLDWKMSKWTNFCYGYYAIFVRATWWPPQCLMYLSWMKVTPWMLPNLRGQHWRGWWMRHWTALQRSSITTVLSLILSAMKRTSSEECVNTTFLLYVKYLHRCIGTLLIYIVYHRWADNFQSWLEYVFRVVNCSCLIVDNFSWQQANRKWRDPS